MGATLALPSDALAVVVLSLANGFAIEQIADPETVDASILPLALQLLFQAATAEAETASETGAAKESLLKALGNQRLLW